MCINLEVALVIFLWLLALWQCVLEPLAEAVGMFLIVRWIDHGI